MPEISMKVRAWIVPNFIIVDTPPRPRNEGIVEALSIPLAEVPVETLDQLCAEFRAEVFMKAGKSDPRIRGES